MLRVSEYSRRYYGHLGLTKLDTDNVKYIMSSWSSLKVNSWIWYLVKKKDQLNTRQT